MRRIYLDHAATTPLLPSVREAMLPWLEAGNPSSLHQEGRRAKAAIDTAREALSRRIGSEFGEVIFTSGGTEAANLAMVGVALANQGRHRRRVLIGAAEHHCVLHTQPILERLGFQVEWMPVDDQARIDLNRLSALVKEDVLLVATMHANNETGTINEIPRIAELVHRHGALLFVDAVQTLGPLSWTVDQLGADLLSVSAHKIGGPKGAGALYIRAGVKPMPIAVGGAQEREVRAGTENVAAIVGFGEALRHSHGSQESARDTFQAGLSSVARNTLRPEIPRLPGHCHVRFPGINAETLLIRLDRAGIAASAGAACSSGALEPSHVLLAMGLPVEGAKEGIRFSLGSSTSEADLNEAAQRILTAVSEIRSEKR